VALPDAEKADVLSRLERIRELMNQLETITADARRREVRDKVRQELDATKQAIRLLGTHDPDIEPA
jgi:hypothetical protein